MTKKIQLKVATPADAPTIWKILSAAIQRRKTEGSNQWQDGYPNEQVIANDIAKGYGYVLVEDNEIVGYCALLINDFVVFHRVAIAPNHLGKGLAKILLQQIEQFTCDNGIHSLRADTNFDNTPMLHLFEKLGYQYCGEVSFRGSPRKAFEKIL